LPHFETEKIDILKKSLEKRYFHTTELIPLKAEWNNWVHCDLNDILLYIFVVIWSGKYLSCFPEKSMGIL